MSIEANYIKTLETENEILRDRVIALEEMIGIRITVPLIFQFTIKEAMLFGILLKREMVTKQMAMDALYGLSASGEEAEIKIIDVFICKIRKKLKPFGIEVETVWGQGYRLTQAAKSTVQRHLEQSTGVAA
jgi:two-component system cell cycle response regulator CtrA